MTHNKYLTFLFFEDSDSISSKSAAKILSLNLAWTFLFLNFLVTSLCSSSASYLFTLAPALLVVVAPGLFSYQKTCRPYLPMLFDVYRICNFLQFHKLYLSKSYLKQFSQLNVYFQNMLHHEQNKLCLIHFYINVLNYQFLKIFEFFHDVQ